MRKLLFFLIFSFTFMLIGCGNNTAKLDPQNPVTLTMWHVYGSQTKSPLNDAIQSFNETEGKKQGVIVKVVSVSNSAAIDKSLISSAKKEPGSVPLPDLFTAYPRIMDKLDNKQLLSWNKYLTKQELENYRPEFLQEGYRDQELFMLPIAKSTELLIINETLMQRFLATQSVELKALEDFETLFKLCQAYYSYSNGQNLFQINDFYHYFLTNMAALGDSYIKDGKPNFASPAFQRIYKPMAEAAIVGGLCMDKGYASDRWKTGEIVCNVGSTAGILYLRDYVTYKNNQKESISTTFLPYPTFKEAKDKRVLIQRGTGLFAIKHEEERKNIAAAVFGKWIGETKHNLDFVTHAGYLPVSKEGISELNKNLNIVTNAKYKKLYQTVHSINAQATYLALPQFKSASEVQSKTEKELRKILQSYHQKYAQQLAAGQASPQLLERLVNESLHAFQENF